jgi:hypothetical protein
MIASDEPWVRAPVCLPGGVEQVGDHPNATLLDLGRLRMLGVVDEVAMEVLGDQPPGLRLHPGGHERGEVPHRDAVEDELLLDQAEGVHCTHAGFGQPLVRGGLEQELVAEPLPGTLGSYARHRPLSPSFTWTGEGRSSADEWCDASSRSGDAAGEHAPTVGGLTRPRWVALFLALGSTCF